MSRRGDAACVSLLVAALAAGGCADLHRDNTAAEFPAPEPRPDPTAVELFLKTNYLYPARDWLTLSGLGRALLGDASWNVTPDGGVADSVFFTNRDVASLRPERLAAGPGAGPEPYGPWEVLRAKTRGGTPGFIGRDASGRTFAVKLDDPEFPELGSAASAIASRVYWALGYHVPAEYVVAIEGTGDARYDGRRAVASEIVPGRAVGPFSMDRFRMRREIRALRVAAAWLNDTDRYDANTLVAVEEGRPTYYLIDFNSALGSWNGRPKEPWRGRHHAWDVEWQLVMGLTLGLVRPAVDPGEPVVSPAVGRFSADGFDPMAWRAQYASTAFDRMTREDARWMLDRIGALSDEQLRAIVAAGRYSRAEDAEYVFQTLRARRERLSRLLR